MKLKKLLLPLLAAVLVLSAAVPSAMAYFTTYTRAKGGYTIRLSRTTTITEEYGDWQKSVTIQNTEGGAVFVRARAYIGEASGIQLGYRNGFNGFVLMWLPNALVGVAAFAFYFFARKK